MGKKRRSEDDGDRRKSKKQNRAVEVKPFSEKDGDENQVSLSRLEVVNKTIRKEDKRLIVVLAGAHLETVKSGKGFGLLNVDEHATILKRLGRDFSQSRPDITHQCLLMLMDSPLNRAGLLQVFIHTANNVLIEINPQTRIPRTFPRFAGLMVQLLHKFSIKASESSIKLMKVIKNPVTDHLPVGCKKYLMSYGAAKKVRAADLVPEDRDAPLCVVIGAIAKGHITTDYTEGDFCIGNYPLSAALTCAKVTDAFEEAWGIF